MPDLLIGRDGALVAVRGAGGELSAIGASRSSFELQRWVEHDGWRSGIETAVRGATFNCDGIACAATVSGIPLAVVRHPAAFAEDCRRAGILVSELVSPRDCTGPKTVVDFFAARRQGAHAIYIDADGTIRVETVAGVRGMRPWSMPPERRPRTGESGVREVRGQSD